MAANLYVSRTVAVPISSLDGTVAIPKFDPNWGTLIGIIVTGQVDHNVLLKAENTSASVPATVAWGNGATFDSTFALKTPLGVVMATSAMIWHPFTSRLPVFDGAADFAGTSGKSIERQASLPFPYDTFSDAGGLVEMTGDAGDPGTATCLIERDLTIENGTTGTAADIAITSDYFVGCAYLTITYMHTPVE